MKNMNIGKKLIMTFVIVAVISSISGVLSSILMFRSDTSYSKALVEYGFAQGDVGRMMTALADSRRSVRDICAFHDRAMVDEAKKELTANIKHINEYMDKVEKNLTTEEGKAFFATFTTALEGYRVARDKVVMMGSSENVEQSQRALMLSRSEMDPAYEVMFEAATDLMNMKTTMGDEMSVKLTSQTQGALIIVVAVIILGMATAIAFGVSISRGISNPIKLCAKRLEALAQGDLKSAVPVITNKDETGVLAQATSSIVSDMRSIIEDETHLLSEMANGNLDIESSASYPGDFLAIQDAIKMIVNSMNSTFGQINQSADQVAGGSDQVSSGAQALSQGATEQASSVQELAATINTISHQVKETAENATAAKEESTTTSREVAKCNSQMKDMIQAMDDINGSSKKIGKIIKTIEDIAMQTNILSLNASVEAARAGAAGKGFAVVAEEVRNLAAKSAEAAKNTNELIGSSIQAVGRGASLAQATAVALEAVVSGTGKVSQMVEKISLASDQQAEAVEQVTQGIDQISSVVQTNSATAEESAAASEELTGQAQMLKEMVAHFRLKEHLQRPEELTFQTEEIEDYDIFQDDYTTAGKY